MLITIDNLLGTPIMSLQTGTQLAVTTSAILDPRQMVITAFYAEGANLDHTPSVLYPSDIRELSDIGMIIDNADKIMSLEGLVRLEEIIGFGFELSGLKVVDERGHKLGKVSGYSVDSVSYSVMQVYTEQSLVRSFGTHGSTIHRTQIVSVSNDALVVQSPTVRDEVRKVTDDAKRAFANPFRGGVQPDN